MVKPEPGEITESVNIIENGDDDELHSQVNSNIIMITIQLYGNIFQRNLDNQN